MSGAGQEQARHFSITVFAICLFRAAAPGLNRPVLLAEVGIQEWRCNLSLFHNPSAALFPERQALVNRFFAGAPQMADSHDPRAQLLEEITEIFAQQSNALNNATFVGWTPEEKAAFEKRRKRLALLHQRLADLGPA